MNPNTKHGLLGYHELFDWYNSNFDESEKNFIRSNYRPMGGTYEDLVSGKLEFINKSSIGTLNSISGHIINRPLGISIALKILTKAESLINAGTKASDRHFLYLNFLNLYRLQKDYKNIRLYAEKMIEISSNVSSEFFKTYGKNDASHQGYIDLLDILIQEKNYPLANQLCEKAISERWRGPWNSIQKNIAKHST